MTKQRVSNLVIEHADIGFRNFSGNAGKYNPEGSRNFCIFLEPDFAHTLQADGWNVKWLEPRDDSVEEKAYIQVSVSYANIPPTIQLVTSGGKTILDEASVHILDWADIENVDLIVNPYHWEVNGKTGIKAYLKTMYVTIVEDEFAYKYRDVPDTAQNTLGDGVSEY